VLFIEVLISLTSNLDFGFSYFQWPSSLITIKSYEVEVSSVNYDDKGDSAIIVGHENAKVILGKIKVIIIINNGTNKQ